VVIASSCRVIYGDTDNMGIVYYANYFRFSRSAETNTCGLAV